MARSQGDRLEYAIKFFLSRGAFDFELALYGTGCGGAAASPLAQFLPQVRNVEANDDHALLDPSGHPLPPCIVMERGESLDMWSERATPDRYQAFGVRAPCICSCMLPSVVIGHQDSFQRTS